MTRILLLTLTVTAAACSASTPTSPSPSTTIPDTSLGVVVPDMADHGGRYMEAVLTGAGVVPDPGDPDGTGLLTMTANGGQAEICYAVRTSKIDTITAVHLHHGAAGTNGEGVFTVTLPVNGYSRGCVDGLDRTLIHQILSEPSDYYIAVHTAAYPNGALRGQLAFTRKPYR
jgi:hypothetical protein